MVYQEMHQMLLGCGSWFWSLYGDALFINLLLTVTNSHEKVVYICNENCWVDEALFTKG